MSPDGIAIVSLFVDPRPRTLWVVSADLRTYLGLSRDGSYLHVIRPARLEDPLVGDGKAVAGELICNCAGASYGRRCYWTQLATALEASHPGFAGGYSEEPDQDIAWMREPGLDNPAGAGEAVEAFRG